MNFKKRPKCLITPKYILAPVRTRVFAMALDVIITALLMLAVLLLFVAFGIDINLNIDNLIASHPEMEL